MKRVCALLVKYLVPNWETGKAVRWVIHQTGAVPMGIAGIYRAIESLADLAVALPRGGANTSRGRIPTAQRES